MTQGNTMQAISTGVDVMKPTIGRRVYFYATGSFIGQVYDYTQPLEAGVSYVHKDGTVNLCGSDHSGRPFTAQHVPFGNFDREKTIAEIEAIADARGYADWMPFQKTASHTPAPSGANVHGIGPDVGDGPNPHYKGG